MFSGEQSVLKWRYVTTYNCARTVSYLKDTPRVVMIVKNAMCNDPVRAGVCLQVLECERRYQYTCQRPTAMVAFKRLHEPFWTPHSEGSAWPVIEACTLCEAMIRSTS